MELTAERKAMLRLKAKHGTLNDEEKLLYERYVVSTVVEDKPAVTAPVQTSLSELQRAKGMCCVTGVFAALCIVGLIVVLAFLPTWRPFAICWTLIAAIACVASYCVFVYRKYTPIKDERYASVASCETRSVASVTAQIPDDVIVVHGRLFRGTSVAEFMRIRESYRGHMADFDFMGCYVLRNMHTDMYYVGQATHVPQRVNAHFTGKGNGDVYADYRAGHPFTVYLIDIMDTNYRRMDVMERDLIARYDSFYHGYNKTRGNRNVY